MYGRSFAGAVCGDKACVSSKVNNSASPTAIAVEEALIIFIDWLNYAALSVGFGVDVVVAEGVGVAVDDGVGVTGREGVGAVGVGVAVGMSVPLAGLPEALSEGSSEASSEGEGLGVVESSPNIFVGPLKLGVVKALYSRPSLSGYIIFFQI